MILEQTTNPTSIPFAGLGYNPMTSLYGQQLVPQGPIGNILSQLGPLAPYAVNPQLLAQSPISSILSQLGPLAPLVAAQQFGQVNPITALLGQVGSQLPLAGLQQLGQQSPISSLLQQLTNPLQQQLINPLQQLINPLQQLINPLQQLINPLQYGGLGQQYHTSGILGQFGNPLQSNPLQYGLGQQYPIGALLSQFAHPLQFGVGQQISPLGPIGAILGQQQGFQGIGSPLAQAALYPYLQAIQGGIRPGWF